MGVTRRSRWALIYTGANQCRLHETPALPAEAFCVHILPSTQYGWQDIENVVKEVKLPWRLPCTRSSYMLETSSMINVGSLNTYKFPLIAHLDEYDTKGHEHRASLLGEAPCVTVVQYYAIELGHGNSAITFGLVPRGRRRCYHDVQRFLAQQRQGWTLKESGLSQMIHTTVAGILTVPQDKCARKNTGLPKLHQGMGTSCCSATCFMKCGEELYAHIICYYTFLPDGRKSINLAVKSDLKYCCVTRADWTSSCTACASSCDLIYNKEWCWILCSPLPRRSATFVLNCGAEPMHAGEPTKSVAATTGYEAARVNGCKPTIAVLVRTIDSAITPDDTIVFEGGVHCRQHSVLCRLITQETTHSRDASPQTTIEITAHGSCFHDGCGHAIPHRLPSIFDGGIYAWLNDETMSTIVLNGCHSVDNHGTHEPQTSMNSWSISHEDLDHIDLDADFEHFTKQLRRGGSQDPSSEDLAITGKVYTTFPFTLVDVLSWGYMGYLG